MATNPPPNRAMDPATGRAVDLPGNDVADQQTPAAPYTDDPQDDVEPREIVERAAQADPADVADQQRDVPVEPVEDEELFRG